MAQGHTVKKWRSGIWIQVHMVSFPSRQHMHMLYGRHEAESLSPQRSLTKWLTHRYLLPLSSPVGSSRSRYWSIWVFIRTVLCSWTWPPPCHPETMRRHEGEILPASLCEVTDQGMGPTFVTHLSLVTSHSVSIAVSYVHITVTKHPRETGVSRIMLSRGFRAVG